jgi:hypothetical protein
MKTVTVSIVPARFICLKQSQYVKISLSSVFSTKFIDALIIFSSKQKKNLELPIPLQDVDIPKKIGHCVGCGFESNLETVIPQVGL